MHRNTILTDNAHKKEKRIYERYNCFQENAHQKRVHFSRKIKYYFKAFPELTKRNRANYNDVRLNNSIYLYYYRLSDDCGIEGKENIGDYLSTVVVPHFVPRTINNNNQIKKTLYGIGSILGFRCQDSIVWGSGILKEDDRYLIRIKWSKLDIRAVRGPKTRNIW